MPKVSIIVPIYDVEEYLRRCIDSILKQTLQDIEIILATDGPECCDKICEEYALQDNRIKIIYHPGSYGKAFNSALEIATGEYIGLVESDDWISPCMYEMLYDVAKKYNSDISKSSFIFAYDNIKRNNISSFTNENLCTTLSKNPELLLFRQTIWSAIYKKAFLIDNNIKLLEERISFVDAPFQAETFIKSKLITTISTPLYFYYQDNPKQSMQNTAKFACDGIRVKEWMLCNIPIKSIKINNIKEAYMYHICRDLFNDYNRQNSINDKKIFWNNARKIIPLLDFALLKSKLFSKEIKLFILCIKKYKNYERYEKFKENKLTFIEKIFSIKNKNVHKVFRLFGVKFKFKNYKKILNIKNEEIADLLSQYNKLNDVYNHTCSELQSFKDKWAISCDLYQPHCVDWFGSFKNYVLEHNMRDIIQQMKYNLDEKSCFILDLFLKRVLFLPDSSNFNEILYSKFLIDSLYTDDEKNLKEDYERMFPEITKDFNFLGNKILVETVYFHNGLKFCNDKMKEYIKNKDFIDGGAWIGDSVLVFNKYYSPRKVYSFEISKKNEEQFFKLMDINNIPMEKYELVPLGLSEKSSSISFNDSADSGTSILSQGDDLVNLISIDEFAEGKDLNIGFLKIDVEGYGYEALKGAEKIIKRDRPIICLAVYHSPHEFFDTKPLLDKITKDLNYKIEYKQMQYRPYIAIEFVIWAYPKELEL